MIAFNKTIAYTKGWIPTLWIGIILGGFFSMLIIFLKPFDTGVFQIPYLTLKLIGYGFCFALPILGVHAIENYFYNKQRQRWYVLNEALYLLITFILICSCSYLYHWYFISETKHVSVNGWLGFILSYGLPFIPILIPIWVYLRSKFGVIEISSTINNSGKTITIIGDNKTEQLTLTTSDFIYAQSQQNYVTVFYKTNEGIDKMVLRSTLSNLNSQLPAAWQVHRSYLVNLDYLEAVQGNSRKRFMTLTVAKDPIPISQKYFAALHKHLSNSSLKVRV